MIRCDPTRRPAPQYPGSTLSVCLVFLDVVVVVIAVVLPSMSVFWRYPLCFQVCFVEIARCFDQEGTIGEHDVLGAALLGPIPPGTGSASCCPPPQPQLWLHLRYFSWGGSVGFLPPVWCHLFCVFHFFGCCTCLGVLFYSALVLRYFLPLCVFGYGCFGAGRLLCSGRKKWQVISRRKPSEEVPWTTPRSRSCGFSS